MVKNSELFDMFNALKDGQSKITERITGLEMQVESLNGRVSDCVLKNNAQDKQIFKNTKFRIETEALLKSGKAQQEIDLRKLAIYVSAISAGAYVFIELLTYAL